MKHLVSSLALFLMAGPALAADLPTIAPPPPAPPTWTGPFLGASIGAAFGGSGNTVSGKDLFCPGEDFCTTLLSEQNFFAPGGNSSGASLAGGAQLGYNFQFDPNFIVGGVIDITALNRSAGTSFTTPSMAAGTNVTETRTYTDSFRHDWLATVRLRAGPTFDNLWIYGTGGLALGGLHSSSSSQTIWTDPDAEWSPGSAAFGQSSSSGTARGYVVGAGAEYRLTPNWSIFGEYLHYELSKSYTVTVAANDSLTGDAGSAAYGVKAKVDGNLAKFGVNYAFWSD